MDQLLPGLKKIAIFRALQLGDMLCAVPAFRALRNAYPNAEITLLSLPWGASFIQRFQPYFDRFIHFPGFPGLPEQSYDLKTYEAFVEKMQHEAFDLIIQMQGNGSIVNEIIQQLGAKHVAGYFLPPHPKPSPFFLKYPDFGMEKSRHLALLQHLGIPAAGSHLEYPITPQDEKEFNELNFHCPPKSYVCIHAGSRGVTRRWPPLYFGALANYCAEKKLTPVLTGTAAEADIAREVMKNIHYPCINLTGKTTMGSVAVLLKNAALLIANSTGVAHIADALNTPSIIISMDGEAERWSPENEQIHSVTDWTKNNQFETVLQQTAAMIGKIKKRKPVLVQDE